MLETNTFRLMMLVGALFSISAILVFVFTFPVIDIERVDTTHYEAVMGESLDADVKGLTAYEAAMYSINGNLRGDADRYHY